MRSPATSPRTLQRRPVLYLSANCSPNLFAKRDDSKRVESISPTQPSNPPTLHRPKQSLREPRPAFRLFLKLRGRGQLPAPVVQRLKSGQVPEFIQIDAGHRKRHDALIAISRATHRLCAYLGNRRCPAKHQFTTWMHLACEM